MKRRDRNRVIVNFELTPEELRALDRAAMAEAMRTGRRANRSAFVRGKLARWIGRAEARATRRPLL